MKIKITAAGKAAIVRVEGRMDAESCGEFDIACGKALSDGAVIIVADLDSLTYISSAGIGVFARMARDLQDTGGEIVLVSVHGLVRDVFVLTQVITLFRVFDSPEAALAGLT
jgi:anti-sigma B factor antagonist